MTLFGSKLDDSLTLISLGTTLLNNASSIYHHQNHWIWWGHCSLNNVLRSKIATSQWTLTTSDSVVLITSSHPSESSGRGFFLGLYLQDICGVLNAYQKTKNVPIPADSINCSSASKRKTSMENACYTQCKYQQKAYVPVKTATRVCVNWPHPPLKWENLVGKKKRR